MFYLLSVLLIFSLPSQTKTMPTKNEIAKQILENRKILTASQSRVILTPSKYSSQSTKTRSWVNLLNEDFESGMPAGWTVINGDNDSFSWVVGTYGFLPPPDYGTAYCLYNDDAAGWGNVSGDSIQTPILGIPDSITYLYLSYGYGHAQYEGESLKVEVRYHDGITWGGWQQLRTYGVNVLARDTFVLDENNDSLQVMWLYRDDHTPSAWGYGSSFDNVLIDCFIPVEKDAGMFSINSPVLDTNIGTFVQVNGTVKNYGTDTFSFEAGVNIYDPDSINVFTNTIPVNDLPTSDTLNIDFGSFQLMKGGIYTVEMYTYALEDSSYWNDSLTNTFNSIGSHIPVEKDAGMFSINSPVLDTTIGTFVQVNGTVKNYGTDTFSFEAGVNIYDPDLISAFTNTIQVDSLAPSDTLNIDFGSFQLTKGGTYTVEMYTYALEDTSYWNDSLTTTFNSIDCSWESIPSPGIRAYNHTVVYDPTRDLFFIMGGDSTGSRTNMDICLEFDPKTNTWDTKEPFSTPRRGHAASYRNGSIHVLCGVENYADRIAKHEVYNINSDSWDTAAPAPLAVSSPSVVTWKDSLIYIMGGYDSTHTARTEVYYYDPETNSWNSATSLPRPLHAGGTDIKGDSIYIVGGGDGALQYSNILLGEINPADPTQINWSWGDPLPFENYVNGLAIKNDKLFMIGGAFDNGTNEVWEYDILDETWTSYPNYPTNIIMRKDFAERRDGPDSLGVIYCFMGDTSSHASQDPTNECYRLVRVSSLSGIEEEKEPKNNSISLNSTISANRIAINCNIAKRCDLKIYMYDVVGRLVFSHLEKNLATGPHLFTINNDFNNGIYFIRIEAGKDILKQKVIFIR